MTVAKPESTDAGQATIEFALILPLLLALVMALVQVGVLIRDQVAVVHAARNGARAAALDPSSSAARHAITADLDPGRTTVRSATGNGRVRVDVTYRSPFQVPIVGRFAGSFTLRASATMRTEYPP